MTVTDTDPLAGLVRKPTSDEISFYNQNGWVKLEHFIDVSIVGRLLDTALEGMGPGVEDPNATGGNSRYPAWKNRYATWPNCSAQDEWLMSVSRSRALGAVSSAFAGGRSMRIYTDIFMAKASANKGGEKTPWHQDLPHQPFDRGGALTVWFPLVTCPAARGSMRFLNGSHRAGPLGRFGMREDGVDIVDFYTEITSQYPLSPPLDLAVGDATVHNMLTAHSAPDNQTDETRWVYAVTYFPSETLFTGVPSNNANREMGLELDKPFLDDRFPIVA